MLKKVILFSVFISLAACGDNAKDSAKKESAQAALDKLKAIDAAITISTNVGNYGELLVDAKPAIDSYVEIDSSSELSEAISQTFDGHRLAFDWWQCDFAKSETNNASDDIDAENQCRDNLLPKLYDMYPDIGVKIDEVVEAKEVELGRPLTYKTSWLDPDSIIQNIWKKTGDSTDLAASLLED
ncbi:hypothetical protein D0962_04260 [Leptolyngbyaceae cyanobacterium CCMR0082]|uniref:Lipoprotein n=1 Tax=Adonisia turfae CCMR0082 TaxID=2304604 RepID=A0A6M0S0K9_9CYAN|nr:hypothetical protein [Adonisia turfae]NEZ61994.1 hypothetical protein [Adonisia turfae CCMR0082]